MVAIPKAPHRPWSSKAGWSGPRFLFGLDIRLANDAAVFVDLPSHIGAELRAAGSDRKQPLLGELWLHLGGLERRAEPAGQLGDCLRRRFRRRHDPIEDVRLV